jgi:hypothetical protein
LLYLQAIDLKTVLFAPNPIELVRIVNALRDSLQFASHVELDVGRHLVADAAPHVFLFRHVRATQSRLKDVMADLSSTWFPKVGAGSLGGLAAWARPERGGPRFFIKHYNATLEHALTSTDHHLERVNLVPYIALTPRLSSLASLTRSRAVRFPFFRFLFEVLALGSAEQWLCRATLPVIVACCLSCFEPPFRVFVNQLVCLS